MVISGPDLSKREFLKICGVGVGLLCLNNLFVSPKTMEAQAPIKGLIKTRLSPYYTSLSRKEIQCDLCPRQCVIPDGRRGFCKVRENRDGKCYSLVYGNPSVLNLDPVEKIPLAHVLPGTKSFSMATAGCNFDCLFCQNWEIAQAYPEEVYSYEAPPELVVQKAREMGAQSMAYGYVEPTIFFEYMYEVATIAQKAGLLNVIHTNGFINEGPLKKLCPVLGAAQVDLKSFSEDFYHELCQGRLAPVLQSLKILRQENIHLEITNLLIPTKNDNLRDIREMCLWLVKELGPDTPLHFNRFYPLHKLNRLASTPIVTLEETRQTALSAGLQHVYIGNVPGHMAWNTYCPRCGKVIIKRSGYMVTLFQLQEDHCGYCGKPIPGIWS